MQPFVIESYCYLRRNEIMITQFEKLNMASYLGMHYSLQCPFSLSCFKIIPTKCML